MITHFVGFTPRQIWRWSCVFGPPTYVHDRWDARAEQEYAEGDRIIYANGTPQRIQDHPEYHERFMR